MRTVCLFIFLTLICKLTAAVPSELISDLRPDAAKKVFAVRESMPQDLKNALKKTFKQRTLALANRREPIRETSFIVGHPRAVPPTRRLITAFETSKYFIVYYQAAGYENGAKVLAFRKGPKLALAWGGVSFDYNRSADPLWVAQQIARKKFLDDYPFIW